MDATKNNETVLHEAIIAADVVLKPSTGCDFDPNFFLAQQYGRPVVYADIMKAKTYREQDENAIPRDMVAGYKEHGIDVWCFTVNSIGRLSAIASMGVSGLITDYPNMLL